ncbi:MAG TPA: ABC transporter permease, partial [Flavitalea sp.]|nr:ABC transporter permease [Flavitalea sp.]
MIFHIVKSYYRSFLGSKSVFFINLFGLSSALACTLLIYLWIKDEMSFDKFHEKDDQLFQVMENIHNSNEIITREATPIGMSELLLETMPEVEYAATVTPMAWFPRFIIEHSGGRLKNEGKFVGEDFFNIFSYPLLYGDNDQVLQGRYSIIISERLAKTLFGSAGNAMGKTIAWELGHFKKGCQVTGVFEDVPYNSQDQFDLILPIDLLAELMNFSTHELGPPGPSSFVILKKETDREAFNKKLSKLMASKKGQKETDFFVVSYSSKYLNGNFDNGQQAGGRIQYVKLFAIIALVILSIACINFMNLTT